MSARITKHQAQWKSILRRCSPFLGTASLGAVLSVGSWVPSQLGMSPTVQHTIAAGAVACIPPALATLWVGLVRTAEYDRLLAELDRIGAPHPQSGSFKIDRLYSVMNATEGRRKVLAAALSTMRWVPKSQWLITMQTFSGKGLAKASILKPEWWLATFIPARP